MMRAMFLQADAGRLPLPDKSVDLVFGSPPYADARTYGIDAQRSCHEWIEWMLGVTSECLRVSRGAVVWVVGGTTRDRSYQPAAEGLKYRWFCESGITGCDMYRPCFWYAPCRIPGSGGDQWFRADVEYVLCFKRKGPLPWTDNTACGHPPKWAPGGEMSHRLSDGARVNQWGHSADSGATVTLPDGCIRSKGTRPSHRDKWGGTLGSTGSRRADGSRRTRQWQRPSDNEENLAEQLYEPPAKANPGTLIQTNVGGGHMGDKLAHKSEAPFPEDLVKRFVLSVCPPGGIVLDPFSGSGTTVAVARDLGCHGIGADIRFSQCVLGRQRTAQGVFDFGENNPESPCTPLENVVD